MKHFGTDGIRALGNVFDSSYLAKISHGIVNLGCKKIIIGRDTRVSGSYIEAIMAKFLSEKGIEVILAGMIPTPTLAFLTKYLKCDYGIVLSASHNPPEYNGIKLFNGNGEKISEELELAIEEYMEAPFELPNKKGSIRAFDGEKLYIEYLINAIKPDLRGMKIILDTANGATSIVAKDLFASTGAEVTVINDQTDGININNGCGATVPNCLKNAMATKEYDIGFTFDGDGDRVMCVVNDKIFNGDHIMYIHCKAMIKENKLNSNVMVGTVMSNLGTEIACEKAGITLVRTGVGDKMVFREMAQNNYNLGGEESGHIIFSDYLRTGDGMLSALLTAVLHKKQPIDKLDDIVECPSVTDCVMSNKEGINNFNNSSTIKEFLQNIDKRFRTVVRASGTEPKIRILVEAEDIELARDMARKIKEVINANI